MPASEAQIRANKINSLKSKGPTSPEGKARSRENALKHGLCSEVVLTDQDAEAFRQATGDLSLTPPTDEGFGGWAAGQVALNASRIERCQDMEQAVRDRIVARAEVTWDEDRRLEATLLGATLHKKPEEVTARLRESYHGCGWLLGRWALLAYAAEVKEGWTPEQEQLAFDLFATPAEFRDGHRPGTEIDLDGKLVEPGEDQVAIAHREIAALKDRQELLRPLDQADRERALADLTDDTDPEIRRLRRYEAALQRRLQWSMGLLHALQTGQISPPALAPSPEPEAGPIEPRPKPEVAPIDVVEARPTPRSASRAEKKLLRAESRREAKLRKLENRRA